MNSKIATLLLAGLALGGCSGNSSTEDVAGGGFETSDLQAVVVDSLGSPVAGARVWLVGTEADTLSAAPAFDSAISDFAGELSLRPGNGAHRGVEAWSGDTLSGFVPLLQGGADTVRIVLRRTRFVFLACSSFAQGTIQFMGSHFQQFAPPVCPDSFLVLVPGYAQAGRVVWAGGDSAWTQHLPYRWDTLPVWHGPGGGVPPGGGGSGSGSGTGAGAGAGGGSLTTTQTVVPVEPAPVP